MDPSRISTQFLFQRLSIAIQRGNAASVVGTGSSDGCFDDVFYLISKCIVILPYYSTFLFGKKIARDNYPKITRTESATTYVSF